MVKLFVGNLNTESKASDLRKIFEPYGTVTECDVVNNYAFVHMEKEEEADAAIAGLQNVILDGARINVERSHGKRGTGGGLGPMRRREARYKDYPPSRGMRPPPPRYMHTGPPGPPPPPMRMGRYGPAWDDGYAPPYAPPPPPRRASPRSYDYPPNGVDSRYPPPERPAPRAPPREPIPPVPYSQGSHYRERSPVPTRDYPPPPPPKSRSRYEGYDSYAEYDRYREPVSAPPRRNDYYESYGTYSSGAAAYDDAERAPSAGYADGYGYGYYDYGSESRSRYNYGRP